MTGAITALRGLEPPATEQEIFAAAQEYVRKVGGLSGLSSATKPAFDTAVATIAAATTTLLSELPEHGLPPTPDSPLRRG